MPLTIFVKRSIRCVCQGSKLASCLKKQWKPGGRSCFKLALIESPFISTITSFAFLILLGTGILISTSDIVCDQEYLSVIPPLKQSFDWVAFELNKNIN